jgi:hypothetical protein
MVRIASDDAHVQQFGNALRIIETYSLSKVIEVYETLIETTLAGATSAAR